MRKDNIFVAIFDLIIALFFIGISFFIFIQIAFSDKFDSHRFIAGIISGLFSVFFFCFALHYAFLAGKGHIASIKYLKDDREYFVLEKVEIGINVSLYVLRLINYPGMDEETVCVKFETGLIKAMDRVKKVIHHGPDGDEKCILKKIEETTLVKKGEVQCLQQQ